MAIMVSNVSRWCMPSNVGMVMIVGSVSIVSMLRHLSNVCMVINCE